MFQHLIASRPARESAAQGGTASLVFHGALLTIVILAGARVEPDLYSATQTRVVPMSPFVPAPEPVRPTSPAPVAPQPESAPVTPPAAALPAAPVDVPTSIPEPGTEAWTPIIATAPSPVIGVPGALPGPATPSSGLSSGDPLGAAEVDVPAALLPRSPLPRYPELVRPLRLEGSVRVRFVVGTDGRVEMSSVRILEATHPAFAESVRAVLPRMRFSPARVGSQRVRQLVELPLGFRMNP